MKWLAHGTGSLGKCKCILDLHFLAQTEEVRLFLKDFPYNLEIQTQIPGIGVQSLALPSSI